MTMRMTASVHWYVVDYDEDDNDDDKGDDDDEEEERNSDNNDAIKWQWLDKYS